MATEIDHDDPHKQAKPHRLVRFLMQVLWPAFMGAIAAVGLLFSLIDPDQLTNYSARLGGSSEAAYTVGFLMLWAVFSFACSITWFLASTENQHNSPDK